MRITPAKWDVEYTWLKSGGEAKERQNEPNAIARKIRKITDSWRIGRPSAMGLALQVLGAAALALLAMNDQIFALLPLAALIGGEVIFISSMDHIRRRSAGDH